MRPPIRLLRRLLCALCLVPFCPGAGAGDDRASREAVEALEAYAVYKMAQYDLAYQRFHALAQKGNLQGMLNVANMLQAGLGVARDERAAADWYRRAAELGSAIGMYYLGRAYRSGSGVAGDREAARAWLTRAADAGLGEAALDLGRQLVAEGRRDAGLAWIRRAAEAGEPQAQGILAALSGPPAAPSAVAPLARAAIAAAYAAIDRAATHRNAPGVVYYLARDAAIRVRLPGDGGWIDMSRGEYRQFWQQTFDRALSLEIERGALEYAAADDAIEVASVIAERIGTGDGVESLRLDETALVRLRDDRVVIERLTVTVARD